MNLLKNQKFIKKNQQCIFDCSENVFEVISKYKCVLDAINGGLALCTGMLPIW